MGLCPQDAHFWVSLNLSLIIIHSCSPSFEALSGCCLSTKHYAKYTEVETGRQVGEITHLRQCSYKRQSQHIRPGLAPEPGFLGPVIALGAMERILYRVALKPPWEPSRGCHMEQVRPVQGLHLSPE